jgi:hypothetical protein
MSAVPRRSVAEPVGASVAVAILIATLGAALIGGCGDQDDSVSRLVEYDRKQPLDVQVVAQPAVEGNEVTAVTHTGADNCAPAVLVTPPRETAGPCVVYMHGFRHSKEDAASLVARSRGWESAWSPSMLPPTVRGTRGLSS